MTGFPGASLLSLLAGVLLVGPLSADEAKDRPKPLTGLEIAEVLSSKRADFPGFDDPRTTLAEALEQLQKIYGVPFSVNERAFRFDQVADPLKTEVAQPNPIPPMPRTTLKAVLRKILTRVPAPSGATFLIRDDSIEITTGYFLLAETRPGGQEPGAGNPDPDTGQVVVPKWELVYASFDKHTLEDALKLIADRTDLSVVLDPRVGEKGKTAVAGTFRNVPPETTLRLLAEMTDLRVVQFDNVFYMTSPERAARLEQEQTRRKPRATPETAPPKPAEPEGNKPQPRDQPGK